MALNVYRPTRNFCDGLLTRFDITTSYFDPLARAAVEEPFRPNTKAVLLERGRAAFKAAP